MKKPVLVILALGALLAACTKASAPAPAAATSDASAAGGAPASGVNEGDMTAGARQVSDPGAATTAPGAPPGGDKDQNTK